MNCFDIPNRIHHEGHRHCDETNSDRNKGQRTRDLVPKQVKRHHGVKQHGRQLSVPKCALDGVGPPNGDKARNPRASLLEYQKRKGVKHIRKAGNKAEKRGELGKLIGNGVKCLAEIADHITLARDDPVCNIRDPREGYNNQRKEIILLFHIKPYDQGNEAKSEKRQYVGDGQYFIFVRVFKLGHK